MKIIPLIWCWVIGAAVGGGTPRLQDSRIPRRDYITPGCCWERAPPEGGVYRQNLIQMPEPLQLTPLHVGEQRLSSKLLLSRFLKEHPGGGIWDCQAGDEGGRTRKTVCTKKTEHETKTNELTQRKPNTHHPKIMLIANCISSASVLNLDSFIWNTQFCILQTSDLFMERCG